MKTFAAVFGGGPDARDAAPGRVNLLGEHTDYNDGFVLPCAIPQTTQVEMRQSPSRSFTLYSQTLDRFARFTLERAPDEDFARYAFGCLRVARERFGPIPPLDMLVRSSVPIGVGLSSSAALEVATLRALRRLLRLTLDDVELARLAQRAEIEYAGVQCGVMDQMASSLANAHAMLFLDTRTLDRQLLPLPAGSEVLVVDSGVPRALAASPYNERRRECAEAARALGVPALRDVSDPAAVEALPEPLRRRARHVVAENARVLRAASGADASTFGALMNASHASLRDDFEVSVPAVDRLVAALQADPRVFGARLTGAGFGGATVALAAAGQARAAGRAAVERYGATGGTGRVLVPEDGRT